MCEGTLEPIVVAIEEIESENIDNLQTEADKGFFSYLALHVSTEDFLRATCNFFQASRIKNLLSFGYN